MLYVCKHNPSECIFIAENLSILSTDDIDLLAEATTLYHAILQAKAASFYYGYSFNELETIEYFKNLNNQYYASFTRSTSHPQS